jgi:hypothetical protein
MVNKCITLFVSNRCNKLDARDTSPTGDGKTCWEASSSNLMHWWLNANRSYVERYLEYKRRLNPEFSIPSAYPDSKHSEIYQGFKNRFGNKSGYREIRVQKTFVFQITFHITTVRIQPLVHQV